MFITYNFMCFVLQSVVPLHFYSDLGINICVIMWFLLLYYTGFLLLYYVIIMLYCMGCCILTLRLEYLFLCYLKLLTSDLRRLVIKFMLTFCYHWGVCFGGINISFCLRYIFFRVCLIYFASNGLHFIVYDGWMNAIKYFQLHLYNCMFRRDFLARKCLISSFILIISAHSLDLFLILMALYKDVNSMLVLHIM